MAQSSGGTSKNTDFQARLHYVDGFKPFQNTQNMKLPSSLVRSKLTMRIIKRLNLSRNMHLLDFKRLCLSFFLSRSASPWTWVFYIFCLSHGTASNNLCFLHYTMQVIYINGRPFVLRDVEKPFSNLEYTVSLYIRGFHNYFLHCCY